MRVYDFETFTLLPGSVSQGLRQAAADADAVGPRAGGVVAICDRFGAWQHVPDDDFTEATYSPRMRVVYIDGSDD